MRDASTAPKSTPRKNTATWRFWAAIGAELSPYVVVGLSLVGLGLVASNVPDGATADRVNYVLYAVGALGFCGAGVGWLLSGYRAAGMSIAMLRTSFAGIGTGIVALSFTVLCSNPCDETFSSDIPGPVVALALLLCAASAIVPLISAIVLTVTLGNRRT